MRLVDKHGKCWMNIIFIYGHIKDEKKSMELECSYIEITYTKGISQMTSLLMEELSFGGGYYYEGEFNEQL